MRKKSAFLILFTLVFCLFGLALKPSFSAHAEEAPAKTFVIKNSEGSFEVTEESAGDPQIKSTLSEAIEYISSQTDSGSGTIIRFDSLQLSDESILIGDFSATFTGKLTSSGAQPVFVITASKGDLTFSFSDIEVDSNASAVIEISEASNPCKICLDGVTKEEPPPEPASRAVTLNSSAEHAQAIRFLKPVHTLEFGGEINTDCETFAEYETGLTLCVTSELTSNSGLNIVVPYYINNTPIVKFSGSEAASGTHINFVPKTEFFEVSQTMVSDPSYFLSANATILLELDSNGGEFAQSYTNNFNFFTSNVTLPNENQLQKQHYNFAGWFGVFETQDSGTFYFDAQDVQNYFADESPDRDIKTFFHNSLDDVHLDSSLTNYQYDEDGQNPSSFLPVKLLLDQDLQVKFIAKWAPKEYRIDFNSQGGSRVLSIVADYGASLTAPEPPTRPGFTFGGWFTDQNCLEENYFDFSVQKMPGANTTLFAKWIIQEYDLSLELGDGTAYGQTGHVQFRRLFDADLNLETPTKEGYEFAGWYEDAGFETPFSGNKMPAGNLTLYAKYTKQVFRIIFDSALGSSVPDQYIEYGQLVSMPDPPTRYGYNFYGWWIEVLDSSTLYTFDTPVTSSFTLVARWSRIEYTISFQTNAGYSINPISASAGDPISPPSTPLRPNFKFDGWYEDTGFETEFNFPSVMPARNIILYAKWTPKQALSINETPQSVDFGSDGTFSGFSDIDGFAVQYFVDGAWVNYAPSAPGTYDVKISRAEDDVFASFEVTIKAGFVVGYEEVNLSWIIVLLFILFALELSAIIFLKYLKMKKVSKTFALFPLAIGGGRAIGQTQFVLLIIGGALTLLGFIYLIYLIVDVHRTAKNDSFLPSKLDNRERFKDDLTFQENNMGDDDYETQTKTDESFGSKYSKADIETLLEHDDFFERTLSRRKYNIEDNSSTNWNQNAETEGSDVLFEAKQKNEVKNGDINGKVPTMFFDEDSVASVDENNDGEE